MALRYTTDNVLVSIQRELADSLRQRGYDILWKASNEVEPHTSGLAEPLGQITLVPEFPSDPAFLIHPNGLNDGSVPKDAEVVVPAFTVRVPTAPRKVRRAGIGQSEFERQRMFSIEGFAADEFQQRELLDFFYEWLDGGDVQLRIWDYTSDPDSPTPLEPVLVHRVVAEKEELVHEVEAIRFYVSVAAVISYIE